MIYLMWTFATVLVFFTTVQQHCYLPLVMRYITHLELDILECKVKWVLGSITVNKASGGDGIPAEVFEILKDDAVKGLHSICQQIWKTQQWPQGLEKVSFHFNPKNGQCQRVDKLPPNRTTALISHASKVMLKIFQARLQQSMN